MIGMKQFFGRDIFRVVSLLVLAAFLTVAITGCDWWDDDDDNTSAGGVATAPAPAPAPAPDSTPTTTTAADGSISGTHILWKPVSDSNGNLVILLPSNYSNTGVAVLSPDGKVLDTGRYVGRTNGNRPTYRFSRPGRSFPDGSILRVGSRQYTVPDTSRRYE